MKSVVAVLLLALTPVWPQSTKPVAMSRAVVGIGVPGTGVPDAAGPATEPEISMLLTTPVSFAMPLVANETALLNAVGAVTVKPKTCFATGKLPVPQVGFVQTTFVPPFNTEGVKLRLFVSSEPVKSDDVGAPAPVTPVRPVIVIVVGLTKRLQLSKGSNVRV